MTSAPKLTEADLDSTIESLKDSRITNVETASSDFEEPFRDSPNVEHNRKRKIIVSESLVQAHRSRSQYGSQYLVFRSGTNFKINFKK